MALNRCCTACTKPSWHDIALLQTRARDNSISCKSKLPAYCSQGTSASSSRCTLPSKTSRKEAVAKGSKHSEGSTVNVSKERERAQTEKRQAELEKDFNPDDFSLATAVALGCCSFEAYNAPYKHYGLKEVSPCRTETIFMDRDFLSGRFQGILEVHLRRATGLPQVEDKNSKTQLPDTRCRVTVFPSSGFSEVVEKSADPRWRQTFFLYVRDPAAQGLEVCVEHVAGDEEPPATVLGTVHLTDLESLCDGKVHNLGLTLEGREEHNGQVQLSVRYQRHSQEDDLISNIKEQPHTEKVPLASPRFQGQAASQAISQMMTDDWSAAELEDWDTASDDSDWRFTGVPTRERCPAADQDSLFDIEGGALADGQPLDRDPWKAWTSLRDAVIGRQLFTSLTPLVFLLNKESDTEVWIYRSTEKRQIVISFRGTSTAKDMLTDMALDLAAFNPSGKGGSRSPEEVAEEMSQEELENGPLGGLYKGMKALEKVPGAHLVNQIIKRKANKSGGRSAPKGLSGWAKAQMMMLYALEHDEMWCHKGFLQAYLAVSGVVLCTVDDILAAGSGKVSADERREKEDKSWVERLRDVKEQAVGSLRREDPWHIFTTGHSMGGALATLCAHELAVRDYGLFAPKPRITMYSFGQPRVGNGPFAQQYDRDVPDSWRVKNADDIVTRVPSLLGYQHIGCEVSLFPHGEVSISGSSTDDVREGAVLTDLIPKIKSGITGEDKELQEEFKQLVKGEVEIFKAIMQGQGISQHMENIYHEYLEGCSKKGAEFCSPVVAAVEEAKVEAARHQAQKKK